MKFINYINLANKKVPFLSGTINFDNFDYKDINSLSFSAMMASTALMASSVTF